MASIVMAAIEAERLVCTAFRAAGQGRLFNPFAAVFSARTRLQARHADATSPISRCSRRYAVRLSRVWNYYSFTRRS